MGILIFRRQPIVKKKNDQGKQMSSLFRKITLSIVVSITVAASLFSQDIPDRNSEWMLQTPEGKYFYLSGFNLPNVWTDAMTVYTPQGAKLLRRSQAALLINNGIADGIVKYSGKLNKDMLAVVGKWDSQKWLETNLKAGDIIRIVPAKPFLPFSITFPVDKLNKAITKDGELVVFTPSFGTKTPSSIYRQQAVISKGRVVAKTGGNAFIPADGFVLSGHGTGYFPAGASRILRWVGLGAEVLLARDGKSFTVNTDRKTWFLRAEIYLRKAKQFASKNANGLQTKAETKSREYIAAAAQMLNAAKTARQNNNNQAAWNFIKQSLAFSENAMIAASLPVPADSIRSVAVPGPRSYREIEMIREAGFNTILLHYHSSTISRLPELLKTVELAREAGLKVFLWTWLPSGFPLPPQIEKNLAKDLKKDGKATNFIDLSIPEHRRVVCKELIRVCELFDADGIMFDYEKYKGGYGKESVKRFCKLNNINPTTFDIKKISGETAKKWEMWQRCNVKSMLFEACEALHSMKRPRKAALCVFPGGATDVTSLQEGTTAVPGPAVWLDWLKTSHFDIVQFMFYSQDINWLKKRTNVLFPLLHANNKKLQIESWLIYWPETCGWTNPVPIDNLLRQSNVMIEAKADGVSFFSSSNLNALNMPYFRIFFNGMRDGIYRLAPKITMPTRPRKAETPKAAQKSPNRVGIWKSKYLKTNDTAWEYYQFGKPDTTPSALKPDELVPMSFGDKHWQSSEAGKHGHPIIFNDGSGNTNLSYVAQKNAAGYGFWSALGFRAPEKGQYSVSGKIHFKRYKNGTPISNAEAEMILFSSAGKRLKTIHLESGQSSVISPNIPGSIEMNKNDLLVFRPFTRAINANVPFQATFELAIKKEK